MTMARLRNFLPSIRRRKEHDLERELRYHVDHRVDDLRRDGASDDEARRRAAIEFGRVAAVQEDVRDSWRWRWVENAARDLRYAVRTLLRRPAFTLTAVLSLALGVGATTTIYTLFGALVFRSLPVPHAERLVSIGDPSQVGQSWVGTPTIDYVSYPLYQDVRAGSHLLSGIYAAASLNYAAGVLNLELAAPGGDESSAEYPVARAVSGNFFAVLQVPAAAGRTLTDSDDEAGAASVVVLSYAYWQRRFGGDRAIVGRTLRLNGLPVTVAGVGARGFTGDIVGQNADLWVPLSVVGRLGFRDPQLKDRTVSWLQMMGRLAPGVTLLRARAEITTIELNAVRSHLTGVDLADFNHAIATDPPRVESGARGFSAERVTYASALAILMVAVGLLALVVCANLANLTLARAMSRGHELTVRMTLGAARRRLIAQLLAESAVIGVAGAALGVLASIWGASTLLRIADSVAYLDVHLTAGTLAFAAAVTVSAVMLFGLIPAIYATRANAATTLRTQARGLIGVRGWVGRSLVAGQIALSMLLLIGAGLLVQTANRLLNAGLGFDRPHVVVANMHLEKKNDIGNRIDEYRRALEQRLTQVPGVVATTYSHNGLLSGGMSLLDVGIPGVVAPTDSAAEVFVNRVGARYMKALGATLISGRDFGPDDELPAVHHAIIDATMAHAYFQGRDPVGSVISFDSLTYTVVGVVRDIEERGVRADPVRGVYLAQAPSVHPGPNFQVIIRTRSDPAPMLASLRAAIGGVDGTVPFDVVTVTDRLRASVRQDLLLTNMTLAFGLVTLLLAALGLYGVTAYATSRRTSEFGLRMALGASSASVLRMVLREAMVLTAIGIAVGVPVGVAAATLIRHQLFGVSTINPESLAVAAATLTVTALLATWVPARRAASAAPLEALRE
jgi:predicted permease